MLWREYDGEGWKNKLAEIDLKKYEWGLLCKVTRIVSDSHLMGDSYNGPKPLGRPVAPW